ncbi:MAG: hypothetical protein QNK05_00925 [Myxococcota bacterium]|nr:hypothetical protein [Myxococcota bacterium]
MSEATPPILALQGLDLEDDAFRAERRDLPERAALEEAAREAQRIEGERTDATSRRAALSEEEARCEALAAEVGARAKELETLLYSGQVTVARELEALQEELAGVRSQLEDIEGEQLVAMEGGEAVDGELRGIEGAEQELAGRRAELEKQLEAGEARIDGELARLAGLRDEARGQVEASWLGVYDRLRPLERLRGRVVGILEGDTCSACRTSLPVMEARRAREARAEERVQCPHCERLLLRT